MVCVYGNGPNGVDDEDKRDDQLRRRTIAAASHVPEPTPRQAIPREPVNRTARLHATNGFFNGQRSGSLPTVTPNGVRAELGESNSDGVSLNSNERPSKRHCHYNSNSVVLNANGRTGNGNSVSAGDESVESTPARWNSNSNDSSNEDVSVSVNGISVTESPPNSSIGNSELHTVMNPPSHNSRTGMISISRMTETVNALEDFHTKENTARAYDGKVSEFKAYCDVYYGHVSLDEGRYLVTKEKVYQFMYYQAFRCSRQGKKREKNYSLVFDTEDFHRTMLQYNGYHQSGDLPRIEDPSDGLGESAFVQYKCSIHRYHKRQVDKNMNSVPWSIIWSDACEQLTKMVKSRKRRVLKRKYAEKIDHETCHYIASDTIERLEEYLFAQGRVPNTRKVFSSLRNRFTFLMTTHGILRGESVYMCELSDLFGVTSHKKDVDPHPCYVLMMQIATGKTNGYLKLYGRVTRHKEAKLCAVGALGFYLLYRFEKTLEFSPPPDFTDNNQWFDWKLLVDLQAGQDHRYSKRLSDKCYSQLMKTACQELNIPTHHFVHIGRILGHCEGEENDDSQEDLQILCNWDPTTQSKFYSKQMPIKGIQEPPRCQTTGG